MKRYLIEIGVLAVCIGVGAWQWKELKDAKSERDTYRNDTKVLLGEVQKDRFTPSHALCVAGRETPFLNRTALSDEDAMRYLRGETLTISAPKGFGAATYEGFALGLYKASDGMLKNHYPKGLRLLRV